MSAGHEIDYRALFDRSIRDFQPARRLWPVGVRLLCWTLLEAAILAIAVSVRGPDNLRALLHNWGQLIVAGFFISSSIVAAFLALKSAIPARELTWQHLTIAFTILAAGFGLQQITSRTDQALLQNAPLLMLQLCGFAALPWLSLFWAVRRAVPLQPEATGATVGLAAYCFAIGLYQILNQPVGVLTSGVLLAIPFSVAILLSALAGRFWLNWTARWQQERVSTGIPARKWSAVSGSAFFPLALGTSLVALALVLKGPWPPVERIPNFDLAIESYQRALATFHPNVPSSSIETMLTAYVEHGMPAYMWDFGAQGFKLVGGRWDLLPDGTPVTYTWFRGQQGGVICLFRQTDGFYPPQLAHEEHRRLLFYRYRDFSLCLINVGGYGNFISVIAAPMPLRQFERLVLAAAL
jgi:hypothetical protein